MKAQSKHVHGPGCRHAKPGTGFMGKVAKLWSRLVSFIFDITKYFFYALVVFLFPSIFIRFQGRFGVYPWNDLYCFCKFVFGGFLVAMAYWSHFNASPPNDPGVIEWEHFRT